jgi:hypothetical protein
VLRLLIVISILTDDRSGTTNLVATERVSIRRRYEGRHPQNLEELSLGAGGPLVEAERPIGWRERTLAQLRPCCPASVSGLKLAMSTAVI